MAEHHSFQAEVSRLLDIVAHSLYSDKRIFLRELIANASDACDKLRFAALTHPELAADGEYKVEIAVDSAARTVTVADNGIGMNHDDLVANLGTIARSGTAEFLAGLDSDNAKDSALIGQFGVGFYSAFMVADKVDVISRRAGEADAWHWSSDGKGDFTVERAVESPLMPVPARGTRIVVHLKAGEDEFLDKDSITRTVRQYGDHIAVPVTVTVDAGEPETVNQASALWTRPKSEITPEQYTEFYRHVGQQYDEPWLVLHSKAEGVIEYTALVFIPESRPFDLFRPERKHHLKLYVKRVFITDDCEGLAPAWLRFLRGIVDSPDVPLNVSREMLQNNPVLAKIRSGLVKRVLTELAKKAEADPADYNRFWENFGAVLKEGLYEETAYRDELMKLARFATSRTEQDKASPVSLDDYVGRMQPEQKAIYYATGETADALRRSPQLEGFLARGLEVLLLTDPVDEFWVRMIEDYQGKPLASVARAGGDLAAFKVPAGKDGDAETPAESDVGRLIAAFKAALGDAVADVRKSDRLTESPVCLVADENAMNMHLERLLKQHGQLDALSKRVLEINPGHAMVARLNELVRDDVHAQDVAEAAHLLLDQARILEGEAVPDPAAFAQRLNRFVARGLAS
ncbi:MAG: molecular chaperone HtpG [Alphaproteobacteria bacterium]